MPVTLSYPGVYIDEVSSGVRTITGVATSIAAFVGYTPQGIPNKATTITSFADFERNFGGLVRESPVSYAVRQFFTNGGTQAIIVRVARGDEKAKWDLLNYAFTQVITATAIEPGSLGNDLRITIEQHGDNVSNPDSEFSLIVSREQPDGKTAEGKILVPQETYKNLKMNSYSPQYFESIVNSASSLIRVTRWNYTNGFIRAGYAVSKPITLGIPTGREFNDKIVAGTVDGTESFRLDLWRLDPPENVNELVSMVNLAIASAHLDTRLIASASNVAGDTSANSSDNNCLKLTSLTPGERSAVVIAGGAEGSLVKWLGLGLANGGREFGDALEWRPKDTTIALRPTTPGFDGNRGGASELCGSELEKTGMYALLDVDQFNLLAIPETFDMAKGEETAIITEAAKLCAKRRAFYVVDAPSKLLTLDQVNDWTATTASAAKSYAGHAAVYFPAPHIVDPISNFRPRAMAPSGTIAGIYARTDATRGVWKAPAGTDAVMNGVVDLSLRMNDIENGTINIKGVNALRSFPAYGQVVWGARTMKGSDAQADEYKYIPVRRLALFLEESLYRGTQWVVFEPNDEPLWAQIRLNLGAFMHDLFRQGAFQGTSPKEAYFVKCDKETTTQSDINKGIVNIVVGFAPLKPAEFVVLKVQQIAGQIPV